jgi:hypothetical protein
VSYVVDAAVVRRQQEAARLAAEGSALARREQRLRARVVAERARHGEAISEVGPLAAIDAGATHERLREDLRRRAQELDALERRVDDEATGARRAHMLRALDSVVDVAAVEVGPDRSVERLRARQAARAQEAAAPAAPPLRDTLERVCGRLDAQASADVADTVAALAAETLEVAHLPTRTAIALDRLRQMIQVENERVARARRTQDQVRERLRRLDGLPGPEAEAVRIELRRAAEREEPVGAELDALVARALERAEEAAARDVALTSIQTALGDLGYAVGEAFDTVLIRDGYADVHRADWPGYAVRVRLDGDRPAMVFNVVRSPSADGGPLRDAEVETAWCDSLARVRETLDEEGVRTELTRAAPPGAVPLLVDARPGRRADPRRCRPPATAGRAGGRAVTTVAGTAAPPLPAPAWHRELSGSLGISPQFVLEGNVHDRYLLPNGRGGVRPVPTVVDAIWDALEARGFEALLHVDPTDGLHLHRPSDAARAAVADVLGRSLGPDRNPMTLPAIADDLRSLVAAGRPVGIVVDRAGRFCTDPTQLSPEQHDFFIAAERLALSARPRAPREGESVGLYNPVFWIVDRDRELPAWLISRADQVRTIAIPLPDLGDRERLAQMLLPRLDGHATATEAERAEHIARFTQQTEGMTLEALFAITLLAVDAGVGIAGLEDAARAYRVGILDNPWRTGHLRDRLAQGEQQIGRRVLGQRDAVRKALDITVRSATGLTGAHGSPYGTRPRGVLFFAGPTGVGKTELAKQLTELIFGDEQAYVRFDMSEFSEEHTAARLIGAPPGYTGYDAGGELTNALRRRPFSLVLFDEIEKAHGRILDKFLQVLEDGRLTDGRGATIFFSETVIVFTSNLGIWVEGPDGERIPNVTRADDRDEAERKILSGIKEHFTTVLGRPELLNRLGDNIVVFDFIDEATGTQILDLLLGNVAARVAREQGATLVVGPSARATLADAALANLDNGGRGIGSVVENALTNPLAREIFARGSVADEVLTVTAIRRTGRTYEVELA